MKHLWLALALALLAFPVAASAGDPPAAAAPPMGAAPGRPAMTPAQRQAMFKTFTEFRTKEMALHTQLRSQILGALSPAHRSAVAQAIGDLAVSASPDPAAAAKRIDAALSPNERQAILSAHQSFAQQNRALMEQMRAQMASEMPSPPPGGPPGMHGKTTVNRMIEDPGMLVLTVLSHREPLGMMLHGFGMHGGPEGPMPAAPPPLR